MSKLGNGDVDLLLGERGGGVVGGVGWGEVERVEGEARQDFVDAFSEYPQREGTKMSGTGQAFWHFP